MHHPVKSKHSACSCGWIKPLGSVTSDQVRAHYWRRHADQQ